MTHQTLFAQKWHNIILGSMNIMPNSKCAPYTSGADTAAHGLAQHLKRTFDGTDRQLGKIHIHTECRHSIAWVELRILDAAIGIPSQSAVAHALPHPG